MIIEMQIYLIKAKAFHHSHTQFLIYSLRMGVIRVYVKSDGFGNGILFCLLNHIVIQLPKHSFPPMFRFHIHRLDPVDHATENRRHFESYHETSNDLPWVRLFKSDTISAVCRIQ